MAHIQIYESNCDTIIHPSGYCVCSCQNTSTGGIYQNIVIDYSGCTESSCEEDCSRYCWEMHPFSMGDLGDVPPTPQSLPPRQLRRRQPYTPGRGRRGRSYNKGGKVNKGRFSGRTQTNPKGRPKK